MLWHRRAVRFPVPRILFRTLLLAALVGCQREEAHYTSITVTIAVGEVNVHVSSGRRIGDPLHPCAPFLRGAPRINGVSAEVIDSGGGEPKNDSDEETCQNLWYRLDLAELPAGTDTLDITFAPLHRVRGLSTGAEYTEARAWHMTTRWKPARIWTEDDLWARMRASEEFEVRWEPADTRVPELELDGSEGTVVEATTTFVSAEPGSARFRFQGPEPRGLWHLAAIRDVEPEVTLCGGFERCNFDASGFATLHPIAISPSAPDGVAPPRQCFAAPGKDGSNYRSPAWRPVPDPSEFHVPRDVACDGADLYFVLLGACGVCGGGKSTYVIGNRGTQAASFEVRSNQETVAGALLEPQQLSAPFEISFQGETSQIEILNDGDCDRESNAQWVANVLCEQLDPLRIRLPISPTDACNNDCGL